jgi:hypothetical protein
MMQNMCQHFQMMQGGDINLRMCGQSGSNNVPGLGNSPESSPQNGYGPNNMPALGNSPWSSPQGAPGPNNMPALCNSPSAGSSPQGAPDTPDIHRRAFTFDERAAPSGNQQAELDSKPAQASNQEKDDIDNMIDGGACTTTKTTKKRPAAAMEELSP